jgi:hypothetical protein
MTRTAVFAAITLTLAGIGACGKSSPTNPSGSAPQVTNVSPADIVRQDGPQVVTVNGRNFVTGLTVELTDPNGGSTTIERSDVQQLQPTSFQMLATLSVTGAYLMRIHNPSGEISEPFSFIVESQAGGNPPHIDSVSPASVVHNTNTQVISVAGTNFSSAINVTLVNPAGQAVASNGAIIGVVLPTSFQIGVTLTQIGTYTLYVTNPTGEVSNSVAISVF